MQYHSQQLAAIESHLKTQVSGLAHAEAQKRIEQFGKNVLQIKKKKTWLSMFLAQFTDFMIVVLIVAAIISGFVGEAKDAIVILAIVIINAIIGFVQEWRAEKAMEALERMAASHARVVRENQDQEIEASQLVPGDVVLLEAGNIIPADVRWIETHTLRVDESSLTGESINIDKDPETLTAGDRPLGDRINMGYKGTSVTNGRARAYVVATGMQTELGKIAGLIQTEGTRTPLQKRLESFSKQLTLMVLALCVVFFFTGWLRGEEWSVMLLTSISLAVAAIPEAMPALITIALALGAKRLAENNALIRKLPAVETLGSVTYICSDKTGTLTINKMTVQEIYEPEATDRQSEIFEGDRLLSAMALNHDVKQDGREWKGDSTEVALARYAFEKNYDRSVLEKKYKRIREIPFDSSRKLMTTLHQTQVGTVAIVKGAIDILLDKLDTHQPGDRQAIEAKANEMASKGYRTLGYAMKVVNGNDATDPKSIELSLTFIGLAGLIDPPREEARAAVQQCKTAGITPVMITGDHKLTAKAIAKELGILGDQDMIIEGAELTNMSEEEFSRQVEKIRVYARVDPEQKLKIIHALQDKNHHIAMTGDGVNDAPALKNADIGVAMGINGTEVSKEAAHLILLDDNFATIIKAVKHGRRIFDNILKFIKYIMTGNAGEIWTLFLAPFFGLPIPLLAIHILWVNLITDGLPGLALASEPAEKNIMNRPPRNPGQNIFAQGIGWHILWVGFLIGIVTLGIQAWSIVHTDSHWQTMTFSVLCFSQLAHVLAIRSDRSLFRTNFFSNMPLLIALIVTLALQFCVIYLPFLNSIFHTQPLTFNEVLITMAVSSIVFWAVELEKLVKSKIRKGHKKA
jgi:Ca2+-transporting ATPase